MDRFSKKSSDGFTLVELAVVLVVIALIIAAIMKGQDILTNMRLNAVVVDLNKYSEAYDHFKEKYNFAPGDYPEASDTWSEAADGDGDDYINFYDDENLESWNHLALSGFIDSTYTGAAGDDDGVINLGKDIPEGPFSGTGYMMHFYIMPDNDEIYGNADAITYGRKISEDLGTGLQGAVFTAEQALWIDRKIDNEDPSSGKVWAWEGTGQVGQGGGQSYYCVLNGNDGDYTDDSYLVKTGSDLKVCHIAYILGTPYINR